MIYKEKSIDCRQYFVNWLNMYNLTRQEVAQKLRISTRSVDRYIKSGKLRSKKDGKVVYVHSSDIDAILSWWSREQEVIYENKTPSSRNEVVKHGDNNVSGTLEKIYEDLRTQIKEKDEIIQSLSVRVGQSEEIAKNSVSLVEFKKSQFLLEESKQWLHKELEDIENEKARLKKDLKYEKTSNVILIVFVVLLLVISFGLWVVRI